MGNILYLIVALINWNQKIKMVRQRAWFSVIYTKPCMAIQKIINISINKWRVFQTKQHDKSKKYFTYLFYRFIIHLVP